MAKGATGQSAALGAQIGGVGHPSGLAIAGQGIWSSGACVGQKLLQMAFPNLWLWRIHIGGGGQTPFLAASTMTSGGGAQAISSSSHILVGGQAGGPTGHSAALGIQIGGIMQPSVFVIGGQVTMSCGGGGIGHQFAHVTPSFSYVDGMHMGGGGHAPSAAAASMAAGGGAHNISLSLQVTGGGQVVGVARAPPRRAATVS